MNNYTSDEILALSLSSKEEAHDSHSRKGHRVFISRYFLDYSILSVEEKLSLFRVVIPDGLSIKNVDTPPEVQAIPKVWEVLCKAHKTYSEFSFDIKAKWEDTAAFLNSCPIPGKCIIIPPAVV